MEIMDMGEPIKKAALLEEFKAIVKGEVAAVAKEYIEPLSARIETLEKVETKEIHTKGHVQDTGTLQEVGRDRYSLPGGSVINVGNMWDQTSKGFRRGFGVFEKLGEETEAFFVKMKERLEETNSFKVKTKALALEDVIRSSEDNTGGLFIPEDIRYALLSFAPPGTVVWPRAQVWPMNTNNIQWPKLKQDLTEGSEEFFGNVRMRWTQEGTSKPKTKAEFGQLGLDCHEISAYCEVTDILIEDSAINIGNLLVQLFQGAYWHYTDRYFFHGVGNAQPLGILNDPNVKSTARVVADEFHFQDALNMSDLLAPMFDAGAVWMMSKRVFNSLRRQTDQLGRPVIELGQGYNDFGQGIAGYMIGYPIVMADYKVAPLGSRGDVVLGNFKHYFIGERSGVKIEMSRHTAFEENRTAFRAAARVGGIPEHSEAFVVLEADADSSLS
jgi:HK97 family phage major capsid protein